MPNIGPLELIIVLVIVLVIFGPKRLPGLGKSLGSGMREFKDSVTGNDKDKHEEREQLETDARATDEAPAPATEDAPPAHGEAEVRQS